MAKGRDYTIPYVASEGWTYCFRCRDYRFVRIMQDLVNIDDALVPDIYHLCTECGEEWILWRSGQYDPLVTLYQMRARGLAILPC